MKKLTIQNSDTMRSSILEEIHRNEDSRYDHRLHAILLISSGMSCPQVADILGQSLRTIQYWVRSFKAHGFDGLKTKSKPGRPPTLDDATLTKVGDDLLQSPRSLGYSQNHWDGKLLSHHLATAYGVQLGVRQCQRLFKRLGFRLRKPCPVIAKADPEAQKAFKKTSGTDCRSKD